MWRTNMSFRKIETLISLTKGKKPLNILQNVEDSYLPYVDIKAFETGIVDNYTDGEKCVSCNEGDLLIVCDGSRSGLVGKAITGYVGSTLARIDVSDEIDINYLYYFIQGKYQILNTNVKGTGTPHLKQDLLKSFNIYLPPIEKQKLIVAKIEELFSKLDKGVEELNKIKEQLKIYRQAVLKEAFEGGFCAKNIHPQIVHISEVVRKDKNALKAGPFGSSLKKEMYVKSGYKIYGQEQVIGGDENIGDYYIDENKYKELISCKIAPNDILISLVGTVGKVLILSANCKPGIINPRLIKVSLDEEKMLSKYFKYYFESGYLRSLYKQKVHGATMDVLNMGMIKELPFPLYPVSEQEKIICEIESRLSVCDKIEQTVNESLQKAKSLRQSILKQAFEGKLV